MTAISSNHFSVDTQAADAVSYMEDFYPEAYAKFQEAFSEWDDCVWDGGTLDWEESGVNSDYICWVIEFIEANTGIYWEESEPWD